MSNRAFDDSCQLAEQYSVLFWRLCYAWLETAIDRQDMAQQFVCGWCKQT
jgi:hypothetical protein